MSKVVKENVRTRDFYNSFVERKKNYFPGLASIGEKRMSYTLYQKIIKRFLLIYFYEVFFLEKPLFFILGGKLQRCRISKFFTKRNTFINETVSFVWFLIPDEILARRIRIDIQKGSTNIMPKLRKEFMESNDVGLLPLKNKLVEDLKQRKLIHKLW